ALTFAPRDWGMYPYLAVHHHDPATALAIKAALPGAGAGLRLWFTEIGVLYCRIGEIRGLRGQAADAAYLLGGLMRDPAMAPGHVLYFGVQYRGHAPAPCAAAGGDDGELFWPDGTPRPAARIVFPQLAGEGRAAAFGPGPLLPAVG